MSLNESVTYGYKGKKYKKLPDGVKTPSGWGTDGRGEFGKVKDAITDALGKTNTKKKGVLSKESLNTKDAKKLNKASVLDQSDDPKDWESARARRTEIDYKDLLRQKKEKNNETTMEDPSLKQKEKQSQQMKRRVLMQKLKAVKSGAGKEIMASHTPEGDKLNESFTNWRKKSSAVKEKEPQKAQDAGAKARRSLQRREYKSKVSDIVPKELED